MDTAFLLDDAARATFLQSVMHAFGCTYICLWSYLQPPNCLLFWDGCYQEENNSNQPSSSSASLARSLFNEYCKSVIDIVEFDRLPGLAFKNNRQYIELTALELQRLASNDTQRLFYQEARIKTAVFMGCKNGEIELGLSHLTQINMEMEMTNMFLLQQTPPPPRKEILLPSTDHIRASSSSSSLRSLSMDSQSEYSDLMFNMNPTVPLIPSTTTNPAVMQAAFPRNMTRESHEQEVMTRAILAVLTSPSSSTSSSQYQQPATTMQQQQQQKLPLSTYQSSVQSSKASAFKNYNLSLAPSKSQMKHTHQSMLKRSISFYRKLGIARREHLLANRPSSTQLHHMISERKRREKLNESFQSLRSLLPPGTKKDKASLLISTREYLSSLKAQVAELSERNQKLMEAAQEVLLPAAAAPEEEDGTMNNQRLNVCVTPVSESEASSSEERIVDLGVIVRGECSMLDLAILVLEFLKQVKNVSLISMEANTRIVESTSVNRVIFRLRIQGSEWDKSTFEEAVRRVVADLAR